VFEVFGSQKDDLWLFEEQLARWKMDKLSVGQRHEVDRLTEQVGRRQTVIDSILSLAEQLKERTIEKVLAKSDLELGLEFLLSKEQPSVVSDGTARMYDTSVNKSEKRTPALTASQTGSFGQRQSVTLSNVRGRLCPTVE
jgi:hypothetical protein